MYKGLIQLSNLLLVINPTLAEDFMVPDESEKIFKLLDAYCRDNLDAEEIYGVLALMVQLISHISMTHKEKNDGLNECWVPSK